MCPNPQFPVGLVTFTEEILNEKIYFLCSDLCTVAVYDHDIRWDTVQIGLKNIVRSLYINLQKIRRTPAKDEFFISYIQDVWYK